MDELTLEEKKEVADIMVALGRSGWLTPPRGRHATRRSMQAPSPTRRIAYRENTTGVPSPTNESMNERIRAAANGHVPVASVRRAEAFGDVPPPPDMNAAIRRAREERR